MREGEWPGTVVIVEFPTVDHAKAWYRSPAYQEILPLRTNNIDGATIIVDGVPPDYDAATTRGDDMSPEPAYGRGHARASKGPCRCRCGLVRVPAVAG